jgi:ornithine decarboxylase
MNIKHLESLVEQHGTPVLLVSRQRVREAYRTLKAALSGVDLYYAVKSNCLPVIISTLREEGALFDVCTSGEIEIVKGCGVKADECLHTHPIKTDAEIRKALDYGIDLFVADNEHELDKLIPYKDRLKLLVRMSIQNPAAVVNLSHKFGVKPSETFALIWKAAQRGLHVEGISFHVGSQSENSLKYMEALEYCRDICRKSALSGIPLRIIDIGGGFPIRYLSGVMPTQQFCQPINEYLERYFSGYRIIAEPGRVLCGSSAVLAARVVGKSRRDGVWWYYLDEGVYGCFSGKMYDHAEYPMIIPRSGPVQTSTIAGPTCDSIDVLYENIPLPALEIGDVLLFESMGAYTTASASEFNGFPKAKVAAID